MTEALESILRDWRWLGIPLGTLAGVIVAGWILKQVLFKALHRWAAGTQVRIDDIVLQALRKPFMVWVLILGLYLAANASVLPDRTTELIGKALLVLWTISLTFLAASLAKNLIRYYGSKLQGVLPVTSLTEHLAGLTVFTIGVLILLNLLGISITPMLTALGVGGLAVALALQDTLANLFAGFYVSIAGHIRVGDYIKLDSGSEGYVTDISWRSTTVRALQNNLIIVPNAKLAQAVVTNYHLPEKRMSLLIPVSVSYESDPKMVERVLVEEAMGAAAVIPGLLAEPAPVVRLIPGFGESSLDFTLICQVAEFVDQYPVQHELRKRIFDRFRAEGIRIPFPIRTLYVRKNSRDGPSGATW